MLSTLLRPKICPLPANVKTCVFSAGLLLLRSERRFFSSLVERNEQNEEFGLTQDYKKKTAADDKSTTTWTPPSSGTGQRCACSEMPTRLVVISV